MRILKKKPSHSLVSAPCQDPAVPRFVARQLLALLRVTHSACIGMDDVYRAMPATWRGAYEHLVAVDLRPAFVDVMRLIDLSEERCLLSNAEAASRRAGRTIDNPLPATPQDSEGDGGELG